MEDDFEDIRQKTLKVCNEIFLIKEEIKKVMDKGYYMMNYYHNTMKDMAEKLDSNEGLSKLKKVTKDFYDNLESHFKEIEGLQNGKIRTERI